MLLEADTMPDPGNNADLSLALELRAMRSITSVKSNGCYTQESIGCEERL